MLASRPIAPVRSAAVARSISRVAARLPNSKSHTCLHDSDLVILHHRHQIASTESSLGAVHPDNDVGEIRCGQHRHLRSLENVLNDLLFTVTERHG